MLFLYALLLGRLFLPPVVAETGSLQRSFDDSMNQRQGAAVALDVETGKVLAYYRMDVAARRLAVDVIQSLSVRINNAGLVRRQSVRYELAR